MPIIVTVVTACIGLFFQAKLSMTCVKDIVSSLVNFVYNIAVLYLGHNKATTSNSKFLFSYRLYELQCQMLCVQIIDLYEE